MCPSQGDDHVTLGRQVAGLYPLCCLSLIQSPLGVLPGPSLTPHHLPASISVSRDDPPHGSQGDLLHIKSDGAPSKDFLSPLERSPGPRRDPKALQASAPAMSPPAPTMPPIRRSTAATLSGPHHASLPSLHCSHPVPALLQTNQPDAAPGPLHTPTPRRRPRLLASGNHMILPYFFSNPPLREACLNHPRDETPPPPLHGLSHPQMGDACSLVARLLHQLKHHRCRPF